MSGWDFGWDAVGALSTAAATIVALGASVAALMAPEAARKRDKADATKAVISATMRIVRLRDNLIKFFETDALDDVVLLDFRIRAEHVRQVLDLMVARPILDEMTVAFGTGGATIAATLSRIPTCAEVQEKVAAEDEFIRSNREDVRGAIAATERMANHLSTQRQRFS